MLACYRPIIFNLKSNPVCLDCGVALRKVYEEEDMYLTCPVCESEVEVPGINFEQQYQHQQDLNQDHLEVVHEFQRCCH